MTLKEQIEQDLGLPVGEPTAQRSAVTGEPYISITHGGIKEEGERCGVWCEYEEDAEKLLLNAIREYARTTVDGEGYVLYWREEPNTSKWTEMPCYVAEIDWNEHNHVLKPVSVYGGFARLLISNKPALSEVA